MSRTDEGLVEKKKGMSLCGRGARESREGEYDLNTLCICLKCYNEAHYNV